MNPFTGIMVYVVIWWTVIFCILPLGVRRQARVEEGHDPGAPEDPQLARKALITTVVSAVLWVLVYIAIEANLVPFRDWARDLPLE